MAIYILNVIYEIQFGLKNKSLRLTSRHHYALIGIA